MAAYLPNQRRTRSGLPPPAIWPLLRGPLAFDSGEDRSPRRRAAAAPGVGTAGKVQNPYTIRRPHNRPVRKGRERVYPLGCIAPAPRPRVPPGCACHRRSTARYSGWPPGPAPPRSTPTTGPPHRHTRTHTSQCAHALQAHAPYDVPASTLTNECQSAVHPNWTALRRGRVVNLGSNSTFIDRCPPWS